MAPVLAVAPHCVEVALPLDLAPQAPYPLLPLDPHQEAQCGFDRLAYRRRAAGAHRFLHQAVVDDNVGPHSVPPNVYHSQQLYTSQAGSAWLFLEVISSAGMKSTRGSRFP